MNFDLKIIETPRDAFQGISQFIPTDQKVRIINSLLKVGFDTVEAGSFVSEKAIPQMADTAEVLNNLDISGSKSRIMVLVGNKRGGMEAVQSSKFKVQSERIDDILFPFSISPSFLKRNLNTDFDRAKGTIMDLMEICDQHDKSA